jgi:1,4-dihydroxy-2-naphthoate octaprenyltransferase
VAGERRVNVWLEAARPRTLPAAVVPVAVGTLAAVAPADVDLVRAGSRSSSRSRCRSR